jgi:hypothetical protein
MGFFKMASRTVEVRATATAGFKLGLDAKVFVTEAGTTGEASAICVGSYYRENNIFYFLSRGNYQLRKTDVDHPF